MRETENIRNVLEMGPLKRSDEIANVNHQRRFRHHVDLVRRVLTFVAFQGVCEGDLCLPVICVGRYRREGKNR